METSLHLINSCDPTAGPHQPKSTVFRECLKDSYAPSEAAQRFHSGQRQETVVVSHISPVNKGEEGSVMILIL